MAQSFEDIVNNMVNIGLGVAATAAEKGKEVLDDFAAKGSEVRGEARQSDFARSMADVFEQAGGVFTDATARFSSTGASVAERILDELILARVRPMTKTERIDYLAHVRDLVDSVDERTVTVEVEVDEPAAADAPADEVAAEPADAPAADATDAKA